MSLNLTEVRQALADRIASVPDVRAYPRFPGQLATSSGAATAVVVMPDDPYVAYHQSFPGAGVAALSDVQLRLQVYCQMVDIDAAQRRVDELLSSGATSGRSLIDAVEDDRTLGGVVDNTVIQQAGQVTVEEIAGVMYATAQLPVLIRTRRT